MPSLRGTLLLYMNSLMNKTLDKSASGLWWIIMWLYLSPNKENCTNNKNAQTPPDPQKYRFLLFLCKFSMLCFFSNQNSGYGKFWFFAKSPNKNLGKPLLELSIEMPTISWHMLFLILLSHYTQLFVTTGVLQEGGRSQLKGTSIA